MEIRKLPGLSDRLETGPVQLGDDWPGIFIRGDNSFALILAIDTALDNPEDVLGRIQLMSLRSMLASCIAGPIKEALEAKKHTCSAWDDLISAAPAIVCKGCREGVPTINIDGKITHEIYPNISPIRFPCAAVDVLRHLIAAHPSKLKGE